MPHKQGYPEFKPLDRGKDSLPSPKSPTENQIAGSASKKKRKKSSAEKLEDKLDQLIELVRRLIDKQSDAPEDSEPSAPDTELVPSEDVDQSATVSYAPEAPSVMSTDSGPVEFAGEDEDDLYDPHAESLQVDLDDERALDPTAPSSEHSDEPKEMDEPGAEEADEGDETWEDDVEKSLEELKSGLRELNTSVADVKTTVDRVDLTIDLMRAEGEAGESDGVHLNRNP